MGQRERENGSARENEGGEGKRETGFDIVYRDNATLLGAPRLSRRFQLDRQRSRNE